MQTDDSSLAIRKLDYAPLSGDRNSSKSGVTDKVEKRRKLTGRLGQTRRI